MRGLLYIVLLGGAVLVLLTYVVLPAAAAGVLTVTISAAGLDAPDTVVRVRSDPPWDLLGLNADQVQVRATHATFHGLAVDTLAIDLSDVAILGRTAGSVVGRLDGVTLTGVGARDIRLATVTLSGTGQALTATSEVTATAAETLVADAVEATIGTRPSSVTLGAPDQVTVRVGSDVTGSLRVRADGTLVAGLEGGRLTGREGVLLPADASLPFTLVSVTVTTAGSLRIVGSLPGGLLG